ncbi:malate:quinone oxidoreductase [Staphylococcus aureus]
MSVLCNFHIDDSNITIFGEAKPMAKSNSKDIVLIGAGVLSTTFGSMLKEIEPDWNIHVYERLESPLWTKVQTKEIMLVRVMQHYVS